MKTLHSFYANTQKAITFFAIAGMLLSSCAPLGLSAPAPEVEAGDTSVSREVASVESVLPENDNVDSPPAEPAVEEEPLHVEPSVELSTREAGFGPEQLATAGEGTLFRARVELKQPYDLTRLNEWGITVLESGSDAAYVQVDEEQLEKLARLGFEPSEINSFEYLMQVYNASHPADSRSMASMQMDAPFVLALSSVDTDNDGLTDTEEAYWCTDPLDNNSDSPEEPSETNPSDGDEVAAILRGITAYGPPFALWPQFTPHNPDGTCPDGDYDGTPDYAEEFIIGTSNLRESSDKDKFDDGQELFGVTYCPAPSGPCGYGILPRAEDAAFVSANLPSWVLPPGNSPFVAAFPNPEVEVVPSSINVTAATTITTTRTITEGEEHTYGTSTLTGTSSSVAHTVTWNSWQSVGVTKPIDIQSQYVSTLGNYDTPLSHWGIQDTETGLVLSLAGGLCFISGACGVLAGGLLAGTGILIAVDAYYGEHYYSGNDPSGPNDETQPVLQCEVEPDAQNQPQLDPLMTDPQCGLADGAKTESYIPGAITQTNYQDNGVSIGNNYEVDDQGNINSRPAFQLSYPVQVPTISETRGSERGGADTTTHTQYQEQTISEASTNQFSESWADATAVNPSHAADLRFTYEIANYGTEYAREITNLTFNVYINNDLNPAHTYVAIGTTETPKVENLFPGDRLTYTSEPIGLTLSEMAAIDEGASIRIVMEDISFGQDQVFYQDAVNGSVLIAMEDGFNDFDEELDTYLIPVWNPSDSVQDVIKRFFPIIEDKDGNFLSIFTPESASTVPELCEQDILIAPASNTNIFCKHSLAISSWWNVYLSDGLEYTGELKSTLAAPNTSVLIRIVSDRDLDGYNDRNEIRLGTDPDDPASHPAPILVAGYTSACTGGSVGDTCTLRMSFENLGNYDAYGVEAILYSPDGLVEVTNNTIGGSGRVPAGGKVVVSENDTFQYTISDANYTEPVIVVSYNDPQGNHRFILPATALLADLNDGLSALEGTMLPDPGVDISSTSEDQANFVIFSPHPTEITDGKLFVEYLDGDGNVLHEDVFTQTFAAGPTVVPVTVDTATYPPEDTILLAFFTDSQGNIIDSSARPLASFGPDPLPEANLVAGDWQVGTRQQSVISIPTPWDFGTVEPGTTLHTEMTLANTGLGTLRYTFNENVVGLNIVGVGAGDLAPSESRKFVLELDTASMAIGLFNETVSMRTSDPNHASIDINIQGKIASPAGTATAYQINPFRPWDQYVYVEGPQNQNDIVEFTHTLPDDPARMFPLYLYNEDGSELKGVGEYGVDFSGDTVPYGVFGDGSDGDFSGGNPNTIKTRLTSNIPADQPQLNVLDSTNFDAGQEVLIIQMQGTNAGKYEFGVIASKGTGYLVLSKNLENAYYQGGGSKAQVLVVPHFNNVTGSITPSEWDEYTGGIVVFRAVNVSNTTVNVTGKGFKGGYGNGTPNPPNTCTSNQAQQGSSPIAFGGCARNANGGGGGGGANTTGSGGGASYGTAGQNGGGSYLGYYGVVYGVADLSMMYLGSGGGGGSWGTNPYGGGRQTIQGNDYVGQGAGIAFVAARNIQNLNVYANGNNGGNSNGTYGGYAGGAGSGGSINIIGDDIALGTVQALGGTGGDGTIADGGNGGVGRIHIQYHSLTGNTTPTANTEQVNYYNVTGQSAPFGVFGNGSDGDLVVANGEIKYIDDVKSALGATASAGQPNVLLWAQNGFAVGQEVMLIQMRGSGAGNYEFNYISAVDGLNLTLGNNLTHTYTVGGAESAKAQILKVPNYANLTVQSGGTLLAHAWNNYSGGTFVARVQNLAQIDGEVSVSETGFSGGATSSSYAAEQGESSSGVGANSTSQNGAGGGGGALGNGAAAGGGGGGGYQTIGISGQPGARGSGLGGAAIGSEDLSTLFFGGAGGGGGTRDGGTSSGGSGGRSGGIIFLSADALALGDSSSMISAGEAGGAKTGDGSSGGGGGGAGGSVKILANTLTIGAANISALGGVGGNGNLGSDNNGGAGSDGRLRIEYGELTGTIPATASSSQVNFYNMTGSSTNQLYLPDNILVDESVRYQLLYGQRSLSEDGGDQAFSVRAPNRVYSNFTMSTLLLPVVGSGSTFDFCLDLGNDATCDWAATSQPFSEPVRLDSPNLAETLNTYIASLGSTQETLVIPIRVNISTPADIFLFNLSGLPGADTDVEPTSFTLSPQSGAQPDNIGEGTVVDVSAEITNNGTQLAENFTVGFYQGDPSQDGTLIGSTFIESLAAGATSPVQTVEWSTAGLTPGNYDIYVKADASEAITETDEVNNITSAPAVVKKKPDLVLDSLTLPNLRQSESGDATVSITNDGEADVIGAVVRLYLGTDETGTLLGSTTVDVLEGETVSGQITYSIPAAGLHDVFVFVDPDDAVLEADETNNTAAGSAQIGWSLLTVDAGSVGDTAYTTEQGYGWLTEGLAVSTCGTNPEESYRQEGSANTLEYQFDNLLPERHYHLDLSFATCSGERYVDIFVDGAQVFESDQDPAQTAIITSTPSTVSLLLDPADYADGSVVLSLQRADGLSGPLVNIIDLQEIEYCYRDSGPEEAAWSAENNCGYDPTWDSDGFNGWGTAPTETMRFSETGTVKYKFTDLDPTKAYFTRSSYYEGDGTGRTQHLLLDTVQSSSFTLDDTVQQVQESLPGAEYADNELILSIVREVSGNALVNEVILEEDTRTENGRYALPGTQTDPPVDPPPSGMEPQVELSSFLAGWSGADVLITWATTTEIDNASFKLFRSEDALTWTEIASIDSSRACGNYTSTTPVDYQYTDSAVVAETAYYYRLQFSGDGCGGAAAMAPEMAPAIPGAPPALYTSARANANPTRSAMITFTVTFSAPVTGVDITDFTLTTTGVITSAEILSVTGSGDTYTVTVSTGDPIAQGSIRLDLIDNDTILGLSSRPLGGIGLNNGDYTTGEVYKVYKAAPPERWP